MTFDETIKLNDPRPSPFWNPTPEQIAEWGPIVREETQQQKREALQVMRARRRTRHSRTQFEEDSDQ